MGLSHEITRSPVWQASSHGFMGGSTRPLYGTGQEGGERILSRATDAINVDIRKNQTVR